VTWTWHANAAIAPGWKVFAHLDGPKFVNADHVPARPFELWKPGQDIRYPTEITLPRVPGQYKLEAGLWNGKNAPVTCKAAPVANNAVTVATIEVTP